MNRLFGFFKEKILEVKQQNKQEIQNIINAFEYEPYSNLKMLNNLQDIKTNYLQWTIMIANQASTGLYFTQLHNKTTALKKIKSMRQNQERKGKNEISLEQMQKTLKQLKQIQKLNSNWTNSINKKVEKLDTLLNDERLLKKLRLKQLSESLQPSKSTQNDTTEQNNQNSQHTQNSPQEMIHPSQVEIKEQNINSISQTQTQSQTKQTQQINSLS